MSESEFSRKNYTYHLPPELIAQEPVTPRDSSRLMCVNRKSGEITHHVFRDLPRLLPEKSLLVANRSKVIRARLRGHRLLDPGSPQEKTGGAVEVFLLEEIRPKIWEALFKAAVKGKVGVAFLFDRGLQGKIVRGSSESEQGTIHVKFNLDPLSLEVGEVPLPPYLEASRSNRESDFANYQTVYAAESGSVAAPTAGLHFTPTLMDEIRSSGHAWTEIVLHVGLGTFRPVKVDDIREHPMHEERFEIPETSAQAIQKQHDSNHPLIAIGTTSLRALESAINGGRVRSGSGRTKVFFYPGSRDSIRWISGLITNFHLPESTLLMLVSQFTGRDLMLRAYQEAVQKRYRFFSYGDAMLIL